MVIFGDYADVVEDVAVDVDDVDVGVGVDVGVVGVVGVVGGVVVHDMMLLSV